ncbi:hypothetical protein C8R45DRAFT_1109596 [Mycena sanguinolenta]|nr:hypothetical protein C8R45DRAFT_1109596 [Mycena sanguinolenta]
MSDYWPVTSGTPTCSTSPPLAPPCSGGTLIDDPRFVTLARASASPLVDYGLRTTHHRRRRWGGLAGLSAAHTMLERGESVLLLDKKSSSVKSSSGMQAQCALQIEASGKAFCTDTIASQSPISPSRAPWSLACEPDGRAKGARVVRLLEGNNAVVGVDVVAIGIDSSPAGLLARYRPDLLLLGTTNNDHAPCPSPCTHSLRPGGRMRTSPSTGAGPFVDPADPGAKTKLFLARAPPRCISCTRWTVMEAMQRFEGVNVGVSKNLLRRYPEATVFAEDTGISTFARYGKDGDAFWTGATKPYTQLSVVIIAPATHRVRFPSISSPHLPFSLISTTGGLAIDPCARDMAYLSTHTHVAKLDDDDVLVPISGLLAAGQLIPGAHGHGRNRPAGSSCCCWKQWVVFVRIAGAA